MSKPLPGGYNQVADLCEVERDVNEAVGLLQVLVNTVKLPAEALTLLLRIMFVMFKALTSVQRARHISRNSRPEVED